MLKIWPVGSEVSVNGMPGTVISVCLWDGDRVTYLVGFWDERYWEASFEAFQVDGPAEGVREIGFHTTIRRNPRKRGLHRMTHVKTDPPLRHEHAEPFYE